MTATHQMPILFPAPSLHIFAQTRRVKSYATSPQKIAHAGAASRMTATISLPEQRHAVGDECFSIHQHNALGQHPSHIQQARIQGSFTFCHHAITTAYIVTCHLSVSQHCFFSLFGFYFHTWLLCWLRFVIEHTEVFHNGATSSNFNGI